MTSRKQEAVANETSSLPDDVFMNFVHLRRFSPCLAILLVGYRSNYCGRSEKLSSSNEAFVLDVMIIKVESDCNVGCKRHKLRILVFWKIWHDEDIESVE